MTDHSRGFVATPSLRPLSWVEWMPGHYFVYICGFRTGALMIGSESCFYRSVDGGGKMFPSVHEAVSTLERLANWIVAANAEMTNKKAVYA